MSVFHCFIASALRSPVSEPAVELGWIEPAPAQRVGSSSTPRTRPASRGNRDRRGRSPCRHRVSPRPRASREAPGGSTSGPAGAPYSTSSRSQSGVYRLLVSPVEPVESDLDQPNASVEHEDLVVERHHVRRRRGAPRRELSAARAGTPTGSARSLVRPSSRRARSTDPSSLARVSRVLAPNPSDGCGTSVSGAAMIRNEDAGTRSMCRLDRELAWQLGASERLGLVGDRVELGEDTRSDSRLHVLDARPPCRRTSSAVGAGPRASCSAPSR